MPMMILRREAKSTTFVTCLTRSFSEKCTIGRDGRVLTEMQSATSLVLSPTPDRPVPYEDGTVTARVAVCHWPGETSETAYFGFRELAGRNYSLKSDRLCDLTVKGAFTRQSLVMGSTPARITYKPRDGKPVVIDAKPGQTYQLPYAT